MPSTRNKVQPQNISHEHELDSKGVYQLANGAWAYRFCKSVNGKNVYKRASTDRKGNPLLTQRDVCEGIACDPYIVSIHHKAPPYGGGGHQPTLPRIRFTAFSALPEALTISATSSSLL